MCDDQRVAGGWSWSAHRCHVRVAFTYMKGEGGVNFSYIKQNLSFTLMENIITYYGPLLAGSGPKLHKPWGDGD